MISTVQQSLIIVAMVTVGTVLTRFLPFILFPDNRETPQYIRYLGKVLPFAVIGLLIVYCLKSVSVLSAPYGIPEGIAIGCIVL
ncbi:MAG: AzlD domain-containing protein, partial [Veillonellales bacterium]